MSKNELIIILIVFAIFLIILIRHYMCYLFLDKNSHKTKMVVQEIGIRKNSGLDVDYYEIVCEIGIGIAWMYTIQPYLWMGNNAFGKLAAAKKKLQHIKELKHINIGDPVYQVDSIIGNYYVVPFISPRGKFMLGMNVVPLTLFLLLDLYIIFQMLT